MLQTRALTGQPTAVRRAQLRPDQLIHWIPLACDVVAEHLRHHGIASEGYPFARCRSVGNRLIDVEAGFPVAAPIAAASLVDPSDLPAGLVLAAWHRGPYEHRDRAYKAIDDWLDSQGAVRTGDAWEVYHDLPACDQLGTRIEVIQPISFVAAPVAVIHQMEA